MLLESKADMTPDSDGATPLYVAACHGRLDVVKLLLQHKAELESTFKTGATPLYVACSNGHLDVVDALIEPGANVNAVCKDGATPLYVAAEFGHVDVVKRLAQAGALLESPFQTGATPLYIAAYKGHADVAKTLVKLSTSTPLNFRWNFIDANVNAALHDGATPLHSACENGFHKIVKLLVTSGATVNTLMTNSCNDLSHILPNHSQAFPPSTPPHFEATQKSCTHWSKAKHF